MRFSSKHRPHIIMLVGLWFSLIYSHSAQAEQPQSIKQFDSKYQQQEKRRRALLQKQQEQDNRILLESEPSAAKLVPENEKPCFVVNEYVLTGQQAKKFNFALEATLEQDPELAGQCLGVNGVNAVVSKIQNQIIRAGYVTTRVLIQPQDMTSGILQLSVIPGVVSEIRFSNEMTPSRMQHAAVPIDEGALLNIRDIEQAVENMRRVPTVSADVDIVPSENKTALPGFSDLIIHHTQQRPFRLTLGVNDSGYDATGRYQGSATLSLDNPLSLNDLFYASFQKDLGDAEESGGTEGYALHYSVPLGYWQLSANTSENEYWQTVAGLNQSYEYSGKSRRQEIGLSRVVFRDSRSKLKLGLKGYKTSSRNFIEDTEIEVQHRRMSGWIASLNYQLFVKQAALDFGLAYQRGTGAFDTMPAPEAAFDEGTSRPKIITANLNFNYPFKLAEQAFNFNSYWEAQWNKTTLVPQDRLSIGGRYTVRGFDGTMTLLAERGWFSQNTLSMRLGQTQHQIYSGIDVGHVSGQSADLLLGQTLSGWVVGIKGHWKGLLYDLFAGIPLEKPDGFEAGRHLGFSLTYQY